MNRHLEVKDLSFTYPDGQMALDNISLKVERGERLAIIGPNGSGKTTLLLQLNGILRGSGQILLGNKKLDDKTLHSIRRRVGIIFQDPNDQIFCPTVEEDVAFGPLQFTKDRDEIEKTVKKALEQVDMSDSGQRLIHHLSLGEKRRISIACVLACDPELLAFDEPSASLDPKHRRELIEFIKKTERTVLIATHDLDLALKTCNRCIVMNKGKIVADGPITELLGDKQLLEANDLEAPPSLT